jgi:hypothetical protein
MHELHASMHKARTLAMACSWLLLSACAPSYYVVRSLPVLEPVSASPPTAEPSRTPIADLNRLALLPWDSCASAGAAEADVCAAGLAALERALLARGFEVVAWQALREQAARHSQTPGEAAQALGVPYLLRVHAPEATRSPVGLRFRRSYRASDEQGAVGQPLTLSARDADRLDVLAGQAEEKLSAGASSALSVRVSLERATGELLWSHHESVAEPARKPPALTLFVQCLDGRCTPAARADEASKRPARQASDRVLVQPKASPQLLERVAEPLAAHVTGLVRAQPTPPAP